MSTLMRDGFTVGGSHLLQLVRQVRQGAGDCELLTDLGYVFVSGVATRRPVPVTRNAAPMTRRASACRGGPASVSAEVARAAPSTVRIERACARG